MKNKNLSVIILAAGEGKRMKSEKSKILHEIAGVPMIVRTIRNIREISPVQIIIVANSRNINFLKNLDASGIEFIIQKIAKGTAHAVKIALPLIKNNIKQIMIVNGDDSALYKPDTLKRVIKRHIDTNSTQTILTIEVDDPKGLGRIIKKDGKVSDIVEEKDASDSQRKIKEINAGLYIFEKVWLIGSINNIVPSAVTGEEYLVDMVKIAYKQKKNISSFKLSDPHQWQGVNTLEELRKAHNKINNRIHFMGIAGAGTSAVAGIAREQDYEVSGCDTNPNSSYTKNLPVKIQKGHSRDHIHNIGALVVSPAVTINDPNNPEILEAKKKNVPVISWQEFQGNALHKDKYLITVAGGYGKSTTTAMIAQIMTDAKLDPTVEIGAVFPQWGHNYRAGKSKYYISEADEYNNNFLHYKPDIAVILNISWDHPDFFKNVSEVEEAYKKYIGNIKKGGTLIIGPDKNLSALASSVRKDIKVIKINHDENIILKIIGEFRKENASAAMAVAKALNISKKQAIKSLNNFSGLGRRLEYKGSISGVKFYDDYAVQPFTIKSTANALAQKYKGKKLLVVFEPHTFSRINTFFDEFVHNMKDMRCQKIYVTDVFSAREQGSVTRLSKKLSASIGEKSTYSGSIVESAKLLKSNINKCDIVITIGAGDVYKIFDLVKKIIWQKLKN